MGEGGEDIGEEGGEDEAADMSTDAPAKEAAVVEAATEETAVGA